MRAARSTCRKSFVKGGSLVSPGERCSSEHSRFGGRRGPLGAGCAGRQAACGATVTLPAPADGFGRRSAALGSTVGVGGGVFPVRRARVCLLRGATIPSRERATARDGA